MILRSPFQPTLGAWLVLLLFAGAARPFRFTLAYEIRIEESQVDDDQLWARMQVVY